MEDCAGRTNDADERTDDCGARMDDDAVRMDDCAARLDDCAVRSDGADERMDAAAVRIAVAEQEIARCAERALCYGGQGVTMELRLWEPLTLVASVAAGLLAGLFFASSRPWPGSMPPARGL